MLLDKATVFRSAGARLLPLKRQAGNDTQPDRPISFPASWFYKVPTAFVLNNLKLFPEHQYQAFLISCT